MKLDVITLDAGKAGDIDLSDDIFGLEPRADLLHRVVRWQRAKAQAEFVASETMVMVATVAEPVARRTATATSQLRPTSSRSAMMRPPTIIIGAVTIIVSAMLVTVCTWVTSLVVREMSVGAPNRATSCALKLPTLAKTAARNRAAIDADRPAPTQVAAIVVTICRTETPSISPPWRRM